MQTKQFWDTQALNFPRYNETKDQFQQILISILKEKTSLQKNHHFLI